MWKVFLPVLLVGLVAVSCDSGNPLEKINNFDQQPMLQNMGTNLILPAYKHLAEANAALEEAVKAFTEAPSSATLSVARQQLKLARLAWQHCTPYQFGPAEMQGLSAELNIYPVDQNQIQQNMASGEYNLSALSNSDAKGYPALGFLLYGDNLSEEEVIQSVDENKAKYLLEVTSRMTAASAAVYAAWKPDGGDYLGMFTSEEALGVNVGSSVGKLVNAFNQDFERNTRDGKVGIPVGIRTNGEPVPDRSEAYFAGYSAELLKANLKAYQSLYLGGEGIGFDDYLQEIGAATTGNENLSEKIKSQFETILAAANQINDPLPQAIIENKDQVQQVWVEMQQLVVLFKTDLASSIGVVISYQDTDGD